jgi:antitoxin (DNA-binding transcriptional repressor) of toxin-antitoxin stability system
MREVAVGEAGTTLEVLLDLVEGGETVLIMRDGRPMARLLPPEPGDRVERARRAVANVRARRARLKRPPSIDELIAWKNEGRL